MNLFAYYLYTMRLEYNAKWQQKYGAINNEFDTLEIYHSSVCLGYKVLFC